jgi:hypothetical protein
MASAGAMTAVRYPCADDKSPAFGGAARSLNLLETFITSDICAFAPDHLVPLREFHRYFKIYVTVVMDRRPPSWTQSYYNATFAGYGLTIVLLADQEYAGKLYGAGGGPVEFLRGIDLTPTLRRRAEHASAAASSTRS